MFYISISLGSGSISLGAIIGGVMAIIVVISVLIIAIPLCICCYLGVGIGAKCRKGIYTPFSNDVTGLPTTTTTTDVTTHTSMDYTTNKTPSPPPYAATEYPQENAPPCPLELPGGHPPQQHACDPREGIELQPAPYPPEPYMPQQY